MKAVGLKVLKNKLSEYVRLAAAGETILVTDRDRVVAELGPPDPDRQAFLADEGMARLVRDGVITPARSRRKGPLPHTEGVAPLAQILAELDEDRADR
jgi:antitoxin (DNA-binding transcriptional repressor) of toxin-antitoxin stability system